MARPRRAKVGEDRGDMISVRMARKDWNFTAGTLALDEGEWTSGHPDAEPEERATMVGLNRRIVDRIGDEVRRHDKDTRFAPSKYTRVFVSAYDREKGGKNERVTEHTRGQMVRPGDVGGAPAMLGRNRRASVPAQEKATEPMAHNASAMLPLVRDYDKGRPGSKDGLPMDARNYFSATNKNPHTFAANRFGESENARAFVQDLYSHGARVLVAGVLDDDRRVGEEGGPYADTLYIDVRDADEPGTVEELIRDQEPDEIDEIDSGIFRVWWD